MDEMDKTGESLIEYLEGGDRIVEDGNKSMDEMDEFDKSGN